MLLEIHAINALCVYRAEHPVGNISRNDFIIKFAWELIKPQIEYRSTIAALPVELKRRARSLLDIVEIPPPPLNRPGNYVGRCNICPRNRNKSTRRSCVQCGINACKDHMRDMCTACLPE